jgi:hypothetical protein
MAAVAERTHAVILSDAPLAPDPVSATMPVVPMSNYVVDLWVHQWRRREAAGQVIVCRYADDLVIGCQHEGDGKKLLAELSDRLTQFGLSVY